MSSIDFKSTKTDNNRVVKMIRKILKKNPQNVGFSDHGKKEMQKDDLLITDIINVLASPTSRVSHQGEYKNGSYRYRYGTSKITVVVAFWPNGKGLNVVTAWRG